MSEPDLQFPFHTTQSEKRILAELHQITHLRQAHEVFAQALKAESAAAAISLLEQQLFPAEAELRRQRHKLLAPLNHAPLRAHFDHTLETAEIVLNAKILNQKDFERVKEAINGFDILTWLKHCEAERTNAD